MNNLDDIKQGQIKIMFFTLKILSLFFSSIPIFQFFSNKINLNFNNYNYSLYSIGLVLLIVCFVMFFWMLLFNKGKNKLLYQKVEMVVFSIVFIFAIYISGANESYYKFLFLFIIVCYTIECGINTGLIIAFISSLLILGMDILFVGTANVNNYFENDLALAAMFIVVAWTLGYYVKLEKSHIKQLEEYANIDGLTGVYNHRYFHQCLNSMCTDSIKNNKVITLIILDIDYFKKYNDIFGHQQGDELLKEFTAILRRSIRPKDILCRYGGDEFCVILPETNKEDGSEIAHKLREAVYNYYVGQENLPNNELTISLGVSTLDNQSETYINLINNADSALYRAKFLRRNKVEVYSSVFDQFKELNDNNPDFADSLKPLKTLITVINSRDTYTFKHVERVVGYCDIMANHLKLHRDDKRLLMYAAYLHDLGKINISKDVLVSDKKLTQEQWEELKRHPKDSADIIHQLDGFQDVVPIVLQHHERYDGNGYPNGIKGDEITYLARILTIVDSFDAMTNQRPYQKIKTFDEAFEEIKRCKGTQFDTFLADKFVEAIKVL